MAMISEQQLCENIDEIMHEVENGATYDISVLGRVVARITPSTPDGPQEVVDPVIIRRIGSMSPAASAAWKKDIDAVAGDDLDNDPWAGREQ